MARLDTGGEDMAHLAQAAQAWLPTDIPGTKQRILDLLAQVAATGANPILELRQGMSWWFGSDAPAMLPPMHLGSERSLVPGVIALEPLAVLRPPTLWPQRPKRFPDELFTSWLWRASVAAAAPAAAFARDVLGTEYDDADREIAPPIVQRLAQLSGQNFDHLAAGTLPARPQAAQDTIAGMAEDVMLRHEGLLVAQARPAASGRARPLLQYCPRCVADDPRPYFRRRWRFAPVVACLAHRCLLQDGCWQCNAPIALLRQRVATEQPHCACCDAVLSHAPAIAARGVVPRQANLEAMLSYLAAQVPAAQRLGHLDHLAGRFVPGMSLAIRATVVAKLLPATARDWFGAPEDPRHDIPLQMLAEGVRHLELTLRRRRRRRRTHRAAASNKEEWTSGHAHHDGDVIAVPPPSTTPPRNRSRCGS